MIRPLVRTVLPHDMRRALLRLRARWREPVIAAPAVLPQVATVADGPPLVQRPGLVAHDGDWQHPAITERHAFVQMQRLLPPQPERRTVYLGFPWATLIDLSIYAPHRADRITALQARLAQAVEALRATGPHDRIVTVCQHIDMRPLAGLFRAAGVTDIFWSHAVIGQTRLPEAPQIALHPFPLYPVQRPDADPDTTPGAQARDVLYSFVGAGGDAKYLSRVRQQIVTQLAGDPRGHVTARGRWHYARTVYDQQILDRTAAGPDLVDAGASQDFRAVMARSVFALCPSGTGPNSIRLWEAAQAGTIPVVMAETYRPPCPDWLWHAATVEAGESRRAVARLPDRLAALAADPDAMALRRRALALVARVWGPDRFVHDVLALCGDTGADPLATAEAIALRRDLAAARLA